MSKHLILIFLLTTSLFAQKENSELKNLNQQLGIIKEDLNEVKDSLSILKVKLNYIHHENSNQLDFYKENQSTIFWMISFFLIIISGSFVLFGYLFRKPDEIWKKIKETESKLTRATERSSQILEKLEFQYEHQESIFILGKKGLFSYDENDWNLVQVYSDNAKKIPDNEKTSNDWLFIGLNYYRNKKINESINAYKKALKSNPESELIWKHLGNAYDENHDFIESINAYNKVLEINPDNDIAYNNLGVVYSGMGNFKEAKIHFLAGIRLNPDNCYVYTNYFELCLTNDKEIEEEFLSTFKNRFKNNKQAMACFDMINIYSLIITDKIKNLEFTLNEWKDKYKSIGENESYRDIENWIHSDNIKPKHKPELLKALNFFSSTSKYSNYD
jgi:tetratricopeptide (TPR) repeat protein